MSHDPIKPVKAAEAVKTLCLNLPGAVSAFRNAEVNRIWFCELDGYCTVSDGSIEKGDQLEPEVLAATKHVSVLMLACRTLLRFVGQELARGASLTIERR